MPTLAHSHDNPDAYVEGSGGGSTLAYNMLNLLKRYGLAKDADQVKPNETLNELLERLNVNPHSPTIKDGGYIDPLTASLIHEVVHNMKANTEDIPIGHPTAPIISTGPHSPIPSGVPGGQGWKQDIGVPEGLQYLTQDECYLVQTWSFETGPEILEQEADGGKLPPWAVARFTMPLTTADVVSHKNEVYPRSVWEPNVPALKQACTEHKLLGNDHPTNPGEQLSETSLLFTDLGWGPVRRQDGGWELMGSGYIYNTNAGRDLHTILQSGVPIDVSSRGFGRTAPGNWRGQPAQVVQSFVCKAFDAVIGGASPGAGFKAATMQQEAGPGQVVRTVPKLRRCFSLRLAG